MQGNGVSLAKEISECRSEPLRIRNWQTVVQKLAGAWRSAGARLPYLTLWLSMEGMVGHLNGCSGE